MIFRRRDKGIFGFGILAANDEEDEWEEFDRMMEDEYKRMWEELVIAEYDFGEDP